MLTTVYHCGFRGQVIINLQMEILSLLISNKNFFHHCVFFRQFYLRLQHEMFNSNHLNENANKKTKSTLRIVTMQ